MLGKGRSNVIVSITSFPARINYVWLTIESLLRQQQRPDKIILWLSKEQFESIDSLPSNLVRLLKFGLEIKFVDGDIRSHKKYYYAFKNYPKSVVITTDDDIFYKSDFIKSILSAYEKDPHSVHCSYGYIIRYMPDKSLCKYNQWQKITWESTVNQNINDIKFFFGSGGGTLFPPGILYKDVVDIDIALKLCPIADDIWLNAMCYLNNTTIHYSYNNNVFLPVLVKQNMTLCSENIDLSQNDKQISRVRQFYLQRLGVDPFL